MVQGSWRMAQIDENIAFPQVLERDPGQNIVAKVLERDPDQNIGFAWVLEGVPDQNIGFA